MCYDVPNTKSPKITFLVNFFEVVVFSANSCLYRLVWSICHLFKRYAYIYVSYLIITKIWSFKTAYACLFYHTGGALVRRGREGNCCYLVVERGFPLYLQHFTALMIFYHSQCVYQCVANTHASCVRSAAYLTCITRYTMAK